MLHNVPAELRELRQWVASGADKVPLNPRTGQKADVTDPATWGSFDEAVRSGYKHVGFVLTEQDPYCIIDLDCKPGQPYPPEVEQLHQFLLQNSPTYTERSTSGLGFHIVCRGTVPAGINDRSAQLEVYSSRRYMVFTGNVVRQAPISDMQAELDRLFAQHRPAPSADLCESDREVLSDRDLVDMAMRAANAAKFDALCRGDWEALGYPSQSEADFALLAILAFYTRDNEQVRRLFRMSLLGKRDKAVRDNEYLNRCLAKVRAAQPAEVDVSILAANAERAMAPAVPAGRAGTNGITHPLPTPHPAAVPAPTAPPAPPETGDAAPLPPPPGLVGELASYFYQTSVRPVPEISLSAALALCAGVCGRAYNISGTGLNQYIIVLAKTGSGKEDAARSIERMIAAVRPQVPVVDDFVGPSTFASGQALVRVLDEKPCFVSVLGEFGLTLQQLCSPDASSAQVMLKKALLDLYAKSGATDVLRESAYSDREKTTKVVRSPGVTILAESTPSTFYEGLDSSHIEEGLIPRFLIVEYHGPRPDLNEYAGAPPPQDLATRFGALVVRSLGAMQNGTTLPVVTDQAAHALLRAFEREATDRINATQNEVEVQLWNRAHLKALKLAGLIAVGCNPDAPTVRAPEAEWSLAFVRADIHKVAKRFSAGDVGRGSSKMENDLKRLVRNYFTQGYERAKTYLVDERVYRDRLVPYSYLSRRTANLSAFRRDRRGASGALRDAIQTMVDSGYLVEVSPQTMAKKYESSMKAYGVGKNWHQEPE